MFGGVRRSLPQTRGYFRRAGGSRADRGAGRRRCVLAAVADLGGVLVVP